MIMEKKISRNLRLRKQMFNNSLWAGGWLCSRDVLLKAMFFCASAACVI